MPLLETAGGGVIDNSQRNSETQSSANIITSSLRFITADGEGCFAWLLAAATRGTAVSISSMSRRRGV